MKINLWILVSALGVVVAGNAGDKQRKLRLNPAAKEFKPAAVKLESGDSKSAEGELPKSTSGVECLKEKLKQMIKDRNGSRSIRITINLQKYKMYGYMPGSSKNSPPSAKFIRGLDAEAIDLLREALPYMSIPSETTTNSGWQTKAGILQTIAENTLAMELVRMATTKDSAGSTGDSH